MATSIRQSPLSSRGTVSPVTSKKLPFHPTPDSPSQAPSSYFDGSEILERDLGQVNATDRTDDTHKFKVPTLRNVTETGPYFHDG